MQTDNRPLEQIGETYVVHLLLRSGFKVLKPYFDVGGTDLVIMSDPDPGAKLGLVQVKYRSVTPNRGSSTSIPGEYLKKQFFFFLMVETGQAEFKVFLFFQDDIRTWPVRKDGAYQLLIPKSYDMNSFHVDNIVTDTLLKRLEGVIIADIQPLTLEDLVRGQNELLEVCFDAWRDHEIKPRSQELLRIDEDVDLVVNATTPQLAWLYAESFLLADTLDGHTFEYCFWPLSRASNTDDSLISKDSISEWERLGIGTSNYHIVRPKYFIANISLKTYDDQEAVPGLYSLIWDSEGEGIEFFIPRRRNHRFLLRYLECGARNYSGIVKTIVSGNED